MASNSVTRDRIDELLAFLPILGNPDVRPKVRWQPSEVVGTSEGVPIQTFPYPSYPTAVIEFFRLAGQACWDDGEYDPTACEAEIQNDKAIATASIDQIKSLLTYCVRMERFGDGHWEQMVNQGRVGLILLRLQQLRELI